MANVCNKNQNTSGPQTFKRIEAMLTDLSQYTSNACNDNFQDEEVDNPRKTVECHSLQGVVSEMEVSVSANRAYDRLMGPDYECSYIYVPHSAPKLLETRSDKALAKPREQHLRLSDDQASVTTGRTSASEQSESESETRTPLVSYSREKQKKRDRKSERSDRPTAAPSYMTVIENNLDEVSKASTDQKGGRSDRPTGAPSYMTVIENNLDEVSKASTDQKGGRSDRPTGAPSYITVIENNLDEVSKASTDQKGGRSDRPTGAPSYMTVIENNLDEVSKASTGQKGGRSDRPTGAPSYMTVIDNNLDEVSKASTYIDAGFDAKISVKRKEQELCKMDLAADVANGNVRCLRINRMTFRI